VVGADSPAALIAAAFAALADPAPAADAALPSTGLPLARERQLSAAFIRVEAESGRASYGTRCSTVVVVQTTPQARRTVQIVERRFGRDGNIEGETALQLPIGA
ncbi:MAG: NRDE family protein, partial [Pseudomonadota bacterium]|nr:NRDE family protein [Pseudomonadota bacterium]